MDLLFQAMHNIVNAKRKLGDFIHFPACIGKKKIVGATKNKLVLHTNQFFSS